MMNTHKYRNADKPLAPPPDYPQITIEGDARRSRLAAELLWQHTLAYGPRWKDWLYGPDGFPIYPELPSGPKATLWDGWMVGPELWPAITTDGIRQRMASLWKEGLLGRVVDEEGYVETDQGVFFAHNRGWPFPVWDDGAHNQGWSFSFHGQAGELNTPNGTVFRPKKQETPEGFATQGMKELGMSADGWMLTLEETHAWLETPACRIETLQAPYMQIRWSGTNLGPTEPYIEWKRDGDEGYCPSRRMYFAPCPEQSDLATREDQLTQGGYTMIPLYKHPQWQGVITGMRIQLGNQTTGGILRVLGLFPNYDTRHNINNPQYIRGCTDYFAHTGDLDFLRRGIANMRRALRAFMHDHHTLTEKVVLTTWVGHDGQPSLYIDAEGNMVKDFGHGIPNNWLDILPFGHYDCYATTFYYSALMKMAALEHLIQIRPDWNIPHEYDAFDPVWLKSHAAEVKERGNALFWNLETGRFYPGIAKNGEKHDIGITLHNLEAIYTGFATEEHALAIMDWVSGRRIVEGDTAQGKDIYQYRFAPLITTVKNTEYWFWGYPDPRTVPFGAQIQDGGAALAFSYFDILARLQVYGPDDAWARVADILDWFEEVQGEGGYHQYYSNRNITLQGGNVGGGLGITSEFFESLLPMQALLHGFLGYTPHGDRIAVNPQLPSAIDSLRITQIAWRNLVLDISVSRTEKNITVVFEGQADQTPLVESNVSEYTVKLIKK